MSLPPSWVSHRHRSRLQKSSVSPEAIKDALADVEALLSYTPAYRRVEILNRSDDGHRTACVRSGCSTGSARRPRIVLGPIIVGLGCGADQEQYAPHVESRLRPDHIGASTTVTVGVTTEPDSLIPDYRIKRAGKTIIDAANEGLRQ